MTFQYISLKSVLVGITAILAMFLTLHANPAYAPCMEGPGINCNNYPPQTLTQIKSDMINYMTSDKPVITIVGMPHTAVHLEVDDSSSNIVSEHDLNVSSYGNASYVLDISSYKPDVYSATATSDMSKISTSFSIGLAPSGPRITLSTARYAYFPGDTVAILGAYHPNTIYEISLVDPRGTVEKSTQVSSIAIGPVSDVDVSNIRIQPSVVKVGDRFSITATFANNSPFATGVEIYPCGEPFSINFDHHVKKEYGANLACAGYILFETIDPGKNTTQTSPGVPISTAKPHVHLSQPVFFRAYEPGAGNATISFVYHTVNQTDPNHSRIQKTASKSFLFMIYDNKTNFSTVDHVNHMVANTVDSPLKQLKSGTKPEDVYCDVGFQLVLRSSDNSPACIKKSDVSDFVLRTWATRTIKMENTGQSFDYGVIGGHLEQAKADIESKSLVLSLKTTGNGTLVIHLPRSLIDPHMNGQDSPFIVLEDGKEVRYKQVGTSVIERTLDIPFQYGTSTIEIIAPEPIR